MAANPQVQFARTPAFANNRAIIDYNTREGHNLYYKNIRGFYGATDTDKFNAQPEGLKGFFNEMIQRVDEADWMDLFMVPLDNEDINGDALFFLKHYGMFTLAALTEYLEVHRLGNQDRWEQDNVQAQMCIMNSLSQDAKHCIGVWADDYTIEGEIQALLLLKVIIRESRGDTNHRKLVLRQQLSSLDVKVESLGWSITKLHTHVKDTVEDLTALGETTQDLLANLFKAYAKVPDDEFVLYVNTKRQLYDEGTNYTPEQIMTFAGDKYKQRVEDKTWIAPSKDQEKIVALEAAVAKLAKKNNKTANNNSNTSGTSNNTGPQRAAWQMVKPTTTEIKNKYTKKVDGKVFKWCNKHGFWSKHSTEQCRLPEKATNEGEDEQEQKPKAKNKSTTTTTQNKKAKLVQALESIHEDDDGMETDEE
jgi:hypothetical protein